MIKTINTGVAELLCVKVPEDAIPMEVNQCTFYYESKGEVKYIALPDGNYQLLGIAHELTEKVWDSVIGKRPTFAPEVFFYPDYTYKGADFSALNTATESGLSLLKKHEVYDVNPYGIIEPIDDVVCCGRMNEGSDGMPECCNSPVPSDDSAQLQYLWREAQQNVGK